MMIAAIEGADARIGKSQGYKGLPVRCDNFEGHPGMTSAWQPTSDELRRLNEGANVQVSVLGEGLLPGAQPPMIVTVGEVPDHA